MATQRYSRFRAVLLLALAALMLACAFLPVYHVEMEYDMPVEGYELDGDIDVTLSAVQVVTLFTDTMYSQRNPLTGSPKLSKAWRQADEDLSIAFEVADARRDIGGRDLARAMEDYVFLSMRLAARSQSVSPDLLLGGAAILSVLYLGVAGAALVLAVLVLLQAYGVMRGRSLVGLTAICLMALPALFIAIVLLFRLAIGDAVSEMVGIGDIGFDITIGFSVANLVLGLLAAVFLLRARVAGGDFDLPVRRTVTAVLTILLCVASVALLFAPVLRVGVKTSYSTGSSYSRALPADVPMGAGLYGDLHESLSALKTIEREMGRTASAKGEYFATYVQAHSQYTLLQLEDGASASLTAGTMGVALVGQMRASGAYAIGFIGSLVIVLFTVLTLLSLLRALLELTLGAGRTRRDLFLRLAVLLLAVLLLVVVILTAALVNARVDNFKSFTSSFEVSVALAPIATLLFSLVALAASFLGGKPAPEIDVVVTPVPVAAPAVADTPIAVSGDRVVAVSDARATVEVTEDLPTVEVTEDLPTVVVAEELPTVEVAEDLPAVEVADEAAVVEVEEAAAVEVAEPVEAQNEQTEAVVSAPVVVEEDEPQLSSEDAAALEKYSELLDLGVITQEDFDAKRRQILGL